MRSRHRIGIAIVFLTGAAGAGFVNASEMDAFVEQWIARMDAKPPEEQVPNWPEIRKLMMRDAPAVGEAAPDFTLKTPDGAETVRLSALRENKPVVLIFGSWT